MQLPPEDRTRSPYTGWTRAHWEAAADAMLAAVRPWAGPRHALIDLPGPRPSVSGRRSDGLEGYARTFQLAALRVAGAGGDDPHGLMERYAEGLDAGTRTPTAERDLADGDTTSWGVITDRSQAMVEASSVALSLRLTRPWLWDRLDDGVRERVGRWLAGALHHRPHDNNWWLFPLTVGGFLAEAGIETEAARAAVDRGLAAVEQWYLGGGWYTDGRPRAFDHYNGWALHLLPVLHAHLAGDAALTAVHGDRLAAHLDGYASMFGGDGAPVHQGRSLAYRFGAAAAVWAGALTGRTPLTPGTTRRIASGALRHFLDRGALDDRGLLTLGWYGPYAPMVQPYSGPASPYWSACGFLGLLLPADHAVWTDTEEPAPAERADRVQPLPEPGWLLQTTAADGVVRLHNHGSDDQPRDGVTPDDPLYASLAHSTVTGPTTDLPDNRFGLETGHRSAPGAATEPGAGTGLGPFVWIRADQRAGSGACDRKAEEGVHAERRRPTTTRRACVPGHVSPPRSEREALGSGISERGRIEPLGAGPGWAASVHRPRTGGREMPGVTVTALTLAHGADEVRCHVVAGAAPGTAAVHGGWAVTGESVDTRTHPGDPSAGLAVTPAGLRSEARCLYGLTEARVHRSGAPTAFGPSAAAPVLRGVVPEGGACLFAAAFRLDGTGAGAGAGTGGGAGSWPGSGDDRPRAVVTSRPDDGWSVTVTWPDGSAHHAELRPGRVRVTGVPRE
ncbi:DUF2264 domain-containing protein [Streptomyces genisteinicus]|uniref:DUF2264 domain-containing protein n=1 Tax=Streptomyces genisteinicus TaxID=2768068 RepID=UPI001FE89505|nr:DUF2264 domain-containing protein [Streptomyces genisteinicus]